MLIRDTFPLQVLSNLNEESAGSGPLKVRGVFSRYDEENANRRIYSRKLWEKLISDSNIKDSLNNRAMIGENDHPDKSDPKLEKASIVVTGLGIQENGEVHGEFEILPTAYGKHLESLLKAGVRVGISSRGEGSIVERDGKQFINEDDYNLIAFDVVANPSTRGAYPQVVRESKESTTEEQGPSMGAKEKFTALQEQARRICSLKTGEISQALRESLDNQIETLVEDLDRLTVEDPGYVTRARFLAEDLIEARKALKSSIVTEKKLEAAVSIIEGLKEENQNLLKEAREAVEALLKENDTLRKENNEFRVAYGVAIEEGEKIFQERNKLRESKQGLLRKYALAIEAGDLALRAARTARRPVTETKKAVAAAPKKEAAAKPAAKAVQPLKEVRALITPKKVAAVTEVSAPAALPNAAINEQVAVAQKLLAQLGPNFV